MCLALSLRASLKGFKEFIRYLTVRYAYKNGAHEAVWDVDIYSKQVSPHDTLAQELILPPNTERAVLPAELTGPGTFAGGN